jgi:hypothetical protein
MNTIKGTVLFNFLIDKNKENLPLSLSGKIKKKRAASMNAFFFFNVLGCCLVNLLNVHSGIDIKGHDSR